MAEGVESEIANLGTKYFCHQCSKDVFPFDLSELICPDCSSGFLEEIVDFSHPKFLGLESLRNFPVSLPDVESEEFPIPETISDEEEEEDSDPLAETGEPDVEAMRQLRRTLLQEDIEEEFPEFGNFLPIFQETALDSFLDLPSTNVYDLNFLNSEYNSDDDVDDIASQLLDQVEISGPPPLTKEQIKALPLVTLNTEHLTNKLQCTICMSDFKLEDMPKKLTCEHLFHEECITPWLEKQASCPNCRSRVKVESKSKRSLSCPRTFECPRNTHANDRRFSEVSSLGDFFTVSMNPFRFL